MWFILDKKRKTVGFIDNSIPKALPLVADKLHRRLENGYDTLEFTVPSNHEKSGLIEKEGFIIYTADKKVFRLFRIKQIEEQHGIEMTKTVLCETASTSDLLGKYVRPISFNSVSVADIAGNLLSPTGWELGECETEILIDIEFKDYPTVLESVRSVAAKAEVEIEFTIELDNKSSIKRKLVNLRKRGRVTKEIIEYRKNLQGFTKTEDTNKLITAMIAVGGEDDNNNPITINNLDIKPPAPFEKVDDYIGDLDALDKWGNEGEHIFGKYVNTEAQNAVDLYNGCLAELKKYTSPIVTYEVDVSFIGIDPDIGDTLMVKDTTFNTPEYITARVLEMQTSILKEDENSLVLGEFIQVKVNPIVTVQKLQSIIQQKETAWDKSKEKANQALQNSNEALNKITLKIEGVQQFNNGQGTIVYRGALFQRGLEIDSNGSTYTYKWELFDNTNNKLTTFNKTGKSITLLATDFNKRTDLQCTVLEGTTQIDQTRVSIIDLNDVISSVKPVNPSIGQIYIDETRTPNMMQKWDGSSWLDLGEVSTEVSEEIKNINQKFSDMANDSLITIGERQMVKTDLTKIIGYVLDDTSPLLPTVTALDTNAKGEFYTIRKSALIAGISTDNPAYTALTTSYNNLKTYLEGRVPLAWDTSGANADKNITVITSTWRDKWLQYNLSVQALQTLIENAVNGKIDGIEVGGRNLIRNSTFNISNPDGTLASWRDVDASFMIEAPETDKPNSNILHISGSGSATPVYKSAYSNLFNAKKGDVFTVSIDFKVASVVDWDVKQPFFIEFYDSTGARVQYKEVTLSDLKIDEISNSTWVRGSYTTIVSTNNVQTGAVRLLLCKNGDISYRELQFERGNLETDYNSAPEDTVNQVAVLEQRVADVEQSTSEDAIVSTITNSSVYLAQMQGKADADSLSDYATSDELTEAIDEVNSDVDKKINGIDFSPYTKKSDLTQTVDDITAKFSKSGGINMLKNSAGFAGSSFWTVSDHLDTLQNDELIQLGFQSAFYNPINQSLTMTQDVYTTIGQVYSFSYFLKKTVDDATNGDAQVDILDQLGNVVQTLGYPSGTGITNGYEKLSGSFTATTGLHTIKFTVESGAEAIATGLMMNIGDIPLEYSLAIGELYNTNVTMNMNGVKVSRLVDGEQVGYNVMTSEKFAGYYDVDQNGTIDETKNSSDEVFRIDGDEFVQKKAVVKEELTMGTIKVVKINSDTLSGWAFVSNQED